MSTNSTGIPISKTEKSPKRKAAIGFPILVICVVVLIGIRIAVVLPWLNYYTYQKPSNGPTDCLDGSSCVCQPLKIMRDPLESVMNLSRY